jgi:hypothetical protein
MAALPTSWDFNRPGSLTLSRSCHRRGALGAVTVVSAGKQVQYCQMDDINTGQTDDDGGKLQPMGDHDRLMLVRPDGSATYTAQANNGDCYWRVAADFLQSRFGQTPSDTQVANFVNVLAAYNHKADANILAVGEKIEIPAPGLAKS